jgi:hypothetical protein
VFCLALAFGQSDGSIHLLVVALHERDVVSVDQELRQFQPLFLVRGGLLEGVLCLAEAVDKETRESQIPISDANVRIGDDRLSRGFDCDLPPSSSLGGQAPQEFQRVRRCRTTRVGLLPEFERLERVFQIPRDLAIVVEGDKELFPLAGALPQLPRFCRALGCEHRLSDPL